MFITEKTHKTQCWFALKCDWRLNSLTLRKWPHKQQKPVCCQNQHLRRNSVIGDSVVCVCVLVFVCVCLRSLSGPLDNERLLQMREQLIWLVQTDYCTVGERKKEGPRGGMQDTERDGGGSKNQGAGVRKGRQQLHPICHNIRPGLPSFLFPPLSVSPADAKSHKSVLSVCVCGCVCVCMCMCVNSLITVGCKYQKSYLICCSVALVWIKVGPSASCNIQTISRKLH